MGGLGIKSAEELNLALFSKQAVKLLSGNETLTTNGWWETLVSRKYLMDNKQWTTKGSSYGWKCIQQALEGKAVRKCWRVGNGGKIRFWWDRWILEEPLAMYPWITHVDNFNNDLVASIMQDALNWDLSEAERKLPGDTISYLQYVRRESDGEDKCYSANLINGKFSVKNACANLANQRKSDKDIINWNPGRYITTRRIWWFLWKFIRDKLPTKENLLRRNVLDIDTCVWCGDNTETMEHLFLACGMARKFWECFQRTFGWNLNAQSMYLILLRVTNQKKMDIWMATRQALTGIGLWFLWKMRNDRIFANDTLMRMEDDWIREAVSKSVVAFKECWTLSRFDSLQTDSRFDAWKRAIWGRRIC